MDQKSTPRELPTKRRSVAVDDTVHKSFRQFATSTGLTSNLALHVLLNCFDAYGDPGSAFEYMRSYEPGHTKVRPLVADDTTFKRFRSLAATLRTTSNIAFAVLLKCFREHAGPIRVEGAGLRIPCPIGTPCTPDAPSAGPVDARHAAPTRLRDGMSAGPTPAPEEPCPEDPGRRKSALLRALIAEEGNKAHVYRKSAVLLSTLTPDA